MIRSELSFIILILMLIGCSDSSKEVVTGPGVFTTMSGTATIEGELFLPPGEGVFPAMIIVAGSGNEPREELEPFANLLNQNGYALYIYDKRGIGGSTGAYPVETLESPHDFLNARAEDVLGIIDLLKSHDQIDNNRIGTMGSSQGAWVNSIVHSMSNDLAYIVMASGGVASTGLENFYCGLTDDPGASIEEATSQLSTYDGPVGFDPIDIIQSMDLPVLWIYGNEDRSHPARYDAEVLEELNKPNFTVRVFTDTDHELLDINTRQPPADLFDFLGNWLIQNNQ